VSRVTVIASIAVAGIAASVLGSRPAASPADAARTIEFSGRSWTVRSNPTHLQGPGPNYFSDSPRNVWVDQQGRLHLKITHANARWYCAAVISEQTTGYGRYTFEVASPMNRIGPSVVMGLFTYSDNPAFNHREIDIEFGHFGNLDAMDGDYAVQPWGRRNHQQRFSQSAGAPSTASFTWQRSDVEFSNSRGTPAIWNYNGRDVPPPGSARTRINLWLYDRKPPADGKPVEVIVNRFTLGRR
jgi:hypothetical protein